MTTKALKKQLAAAIAMVLVAAIALGSSTYAWFANNNEVKATGMTITAITEGANLEISFSTTFTPGTIAVEYASADTELKPTHYVTSAEMTSSGYGASTDATMEAGKWAHAFSNKYNAVATENTYENAKVVDAVGELGADQSSTDYALIVPIYLRLNPQSKITMTNIKATAEITQSDAGTANKGMTTAGRVAFIDGANASTKEVVDLIGHKTGDITTANVCANITTAGDDGKKLVYAVIYFDGDDESCTSEKFDTDKYTVNLTFTGTEGAAIQ